MGPLEIEIKALEEAFLATLGMAADPTVDQAAWKDLLHQEWRKLANLYKQARIDVACLKGQAHTFRDINGDLTR